MKLVATLLLSLFVSLTIASSSQNNCGLQLNKHVSEFIIGGQDVQPGEFPWQVEVYSIYNYCGGTLINDNWVLTAGHCTGHGSNQVNPDNYTAYVGLNYKSLPAKNNDEMEKHLAKVVKVVPHPGFKMSFDNINKASKIENDLSLLKIDLDSVDTSIRSLVMPICMLDSKPDRVNLTTDCWTTGFGARSNNLTDYYSNFTMQKLTDWVTDDDKCKSLNPDFNSTQQLCVGGRAKAGQGACHGDSGSAFECRGTDGRFYQFGITSYLVSKNIQCAQPDAPDVYTKVSHYIDWIEETINQ